LRHNTAPLLISIVRTTELRETKGLSSLDSDAYGDRQYAPVLGLVAPD
jgi:hypothetical protein